jgi:hypothetical protein
MTTNHTAARWRQIAATSAIFFIAAVSVATATATTADARVKNGIDDFNSCIQEAVKYRLDHGYDLNMDEIQIGCCAAIGGEIRTDADGHFTNCIFNSTNEPGHPVVPPGATAILPPDAGQTELGPTRPPEPTAILPPGLNTRTGTQ